ncbi:MAG: cytochrome c [Vicinamibacterales bacterium]
MKQTRLSFTVALAVATVLLGISASRSVVFAQAKNTWSGVFTAEQVARGKEKAIAECSSCHGMTFKGDLAPSLVGPDFIDHWYDARLGELALRVQNTMPASAPGTLKPEEYADVLAFILSENGFPAGSDTLKMTPVDALDAIKITKTK